MSLAIGACCCCSLGKSSKSISSDGAIGLAASFSVVNLLRLNITKKKPSLAKAMFLILSKSERVNANKYVFPNFPNPK
jgi:hypothetical protein